MTQINDLERAIAFLTIEHKVLTPTNARRLIDKSRLQKLPVDQLFKEAVQESVALRAIANSLGVKYVDLYATILEFKFDEKLVKDADYDTLAKYSAIPMLTDDSKVVIVTADVNKIELTDYLKAKYKTGFKLALGSKIQIQNKLALYRSAPDINIVQNSQSSTQVAPPREFVTNRSPMQEWLDATLSSAVAQGASDVHFMFNADKSILLRFRIDGILKQQNLNSNLRGTEVVAALLTRCSTMDPTNFITPQDGTFSFYAAGRQIDARVAVLPQTNGPTCVIRLLDSDNMKTKLDDMGFSPSHLHLIREKMGQSQGTILAVGPTGSGKTTSLYAMLREVNALEKNVLTVEDPIEYRFANIGQTEIRSGLGDRSLTFARALRSILRLDPDVILVGEIRDSETAEVAMQAAITGHLVLSSLHANSAIASYNRLNNMGLPSYLSEAAINLIISQRLLRRLHECHGVREISKEELNIYKMLKLDAPETVGVPVGCGGCGNTGFRGRIAAVEVLSPSNKFKELLNKKASLEKLLDQARDEGYLTIIDDGARHVREYHTTPAELTRVLTVEEAE